MHRTNKFVLFLLLSILSIVPAQFQKICDTLNFKDPCQLHNFEIDLDSVENSKIYGIAMSQILHPRKFSIGVCGGSCGICGNNITSHGRFLEMFRFKYILFDNNVINFYKHNKGHRSKQYYIIIHKASW